MKPQRLLIVAISLSLAPIALELAQDGHAAAVMSRKMLYRVRSMTDARSSSSVHRSCGVRRDSERAETQKEPCSARAAGVGKTFIAKRIAAVLIGSEDGIHRELKLMSTEVSVARWRPYEPAFKYQ